MEVVGTAADEDSATQQLSSLANGLDLILIDIFKKSGSGMGVLRAARRAGLNACRVVLTDYACPDVRQRCTVFGAHRVFDKSTDLDELVLYCTDLGI